MRAQGTSKQRITRLCLANRPKVGGTAADSRRLPDYGNNFLKLSPLQKGSPLRHILLLSNFCDHSHNPIPKTRPTSHDTLLKSGKS
jgi:hypothetical protein